MNKLKIFASITVLLLTTIGIFGNKTKFSTYVLFGYERSSGVYMPLMWGSGFLNGLGYSSTATPAWLSGGTCNFLLYTGVPGSTYYPVYIESCP
jgi:hypothetical protein